MNALLSKIVRRLLALPKLKPPSLPSMVRRLHELYGLRPELIAELLDYRPGGQYGQVTLTDQVKGWLSNQVVAGEAETYGPRLSQILKIVGILSPASHRLDGPDLEQQLTGHLHREVRGCTLLELIQQHRWSEAKRIAQRMVLDRIEHPRASRTL
jgi:hypothetical protein